MILFVDACARGASRTRALGEYLLKQLPGEVTTVRLYEEALPAADEAHLTRRNESLASGDFSHEDFRFARQFALADTVVIAAPFWDLSFPAVLKKYIEAVSVTGVTFRYSAEGIPESLCRLKKLFYVTTAGGPVFDSAFGFGYVSAIARGYFGAEEMVLFSAEGLDIAGNDPEAILRSARENIRAAFPA